MGRDQQEGAPGLAWGTVVGQIHNGCAMLPWWGVPTAIVAPYRETGGGRGRGLCAARAGGCGHFLDGGGYRDPIPVQILRSVASGRPAVCGGVG